VLNLVVLRHLHDDPIWTGRIERTLRLFADRLEQIGRAVPMMAAAFSTYTSGLQQVVIVGEGEAAEPLLAAASGGYRPFTLVLPLTPERQREFGEVAPFLSAMQPVDAGAAAYVCRDFACRAPVTTADELARELDAAGRA
jgi:uncharacterized protein YyaL (SSP411 family)